MKWIVAIPVWGDSFIDQCSKVLIPSLVEAARHARANVEIIAYVEFHTQVLKQASDSVRFSSYPIALCGTDTPNKYEKMSNAHKHALTNAEHGTAVMLCTSDMVVSKEVFQASAKAFRKGAKAIVAGPSRTLEGNPPPIGAASSVLLNWSIDNFHPFTLETFIGGSALPPSTMRMNIGSNIIMRGFHLHPLAIKKDRPLKFTGTVDQDLLDNFRRDEIHVVTDCNELSIAEISSKNLHYRLARKPLDATAIIQWAWKSCTPINWWLATHRIVLRGYPQFDFAEQELWDFIMLNNPSELDAP